MSKRTLACFVLCVVQTVCAGCLLTFAVLKTRFEFCYDFTIDSYVFASFHAVAGILGAIDYYPRRSPDGNRICVLLYVVFCLFLLFTFYIYESSCLFGTNRQNEKNGMFLVLLIDILLSYAIQLIAVLGVALSFLDLKNFLAEDTASNLSFSDKPGGKQYIQLPEARRHVQEAQGTGEKIVVITLPYTENVVYAVPEGSYVIMRQGAYVAPAGNTRLTMFFPTYSKFQVD